MKTYFFAYVIALKIHALKIKVTVDLEKGLCNVIVLFCFVSYSKNFRSSDFCLILFLPITILRKQDGLNVTPPPPSPPTTPYNCERSLLPFLIN